MCNIGLIIWPETGSDAIKHYLGFVIKVTEFLGLKFEPSMPDPIEVSRSYVEGRISEEEYLAAGKIWVKYLQRDPVKAVSDFHSKDILHTRIAISLLTKTTADLEELGESLDWFLQFLELLGYNLQSPIHNVRNMKKNYFEFEKS